MREEKIRSTKIQIEEFKGSFIWLDIVDELNRLAKHSLIEYDLVGEPHADGQGSTVVPNTAETLIHLGDIKGRRKAVQYFLSIPDIFLQIIEINEGDKKSQQEVS